MLVAILLVGVAVAPTITHILPFQATAFPLFPEKGLFAESDHV